jgi:hypothetical protein
MQVFNFLIFIVLSGSHSENFSPDMNNACELDLREAGEAAVDRMVLLEDKESSPRQQRVREQLRCGILLEILVLREGFGFRF